MKFLVTLLLVLNLSVAAHAEDKKIEIVIDKDGEVTEVKKVEPTKSEEDDEEKVEAPSPRFAPDFCDFEITFPEPPAVAQKCVPNGGCYTVNSYTMVYDLQTTVDVSVSCSPSTPARYKQYNEPVMKAAIAGMIQDQNLKNPDIQIKEYENTKSAAITGVGQKGMSEKIYSAQIWIGQNSVFTIQAELIGSTHEKADKTFRDILQSIKTKQGKQLPKPKEYKPRSN